MKIVCLFLVAHEITLEDIILECRLAADSLSPYPGVHHCYRDLLQHKLDALLFNETTYSWFHRRHKLKPSFFTKCQDFIFSLLQILNKHNCLEDKELLYKLNSPSSKVDDNPLILLNAIMKETEGFDAYDVESSDPMILLHQWEYRCSCYLSYLFNGNLFGGKFGFSNLIDSLEHLGSHDAEIIQDFLAFLLHFRSSHWPEPFDKSFLFKINEATRIETILFNEKTVQVLLRCGYLRRLFSSESVAQDDQFIFIICVLLQSHEAFSLKLTIFQQIFLFCSEDKDISLDPQRQKNFLMGVLPSLIHLVKSTCQSPLASPTESRYAPFFTTLSVAALLTMSAGNTLVKTLLLDSGIGDVVVTQLRVADAELQQYCVELCINLTKTSGQRQRFIDAGLLPILVEIFLTKYKSPHDYGRIVVYEIAGVLGQLANEAESRHELVTKYPVLDCLFYLFHNAEPYSIGSLRTVYCLRQLGNENWQVKQRIGLHVIQPVLHTLKYLELAPLDARVSYTSRCLTLLLTLAKYKPNCFKLKEYAMEAILLNLKGLIPLSSALDEKCCLLIQNVTKNTTQALL